MNGFTFFVIDFIMYSRVFTRCECIEYHRCNHQGYNITDYYGPQMILGMAQHSC